MGAAGAEFVVTGAPVAVCPDGTGAALLGAGYAYAGGGGGGAIGSPGGGARSESMAVFGSIVCTCAASGADARPRQIAKDTATRHMVVPASLFINIRTIPAFDNTIPRIRRAT